MLHPVRFAKVVTMVAQSVQFTIGPRPVPPPSFTRKLVNRNTLPLLARIIHGAPWKRWWAWI